jgi:small subunit ribosomal protein S16
MLRIRLRRTGAKKKPSYRVVVADARAPRDGAFLEILGHYNPLTDPATVVIDADRAQRWLANGAQPSNRVARLFKREGIERTSAGAPASAEAAEPEASKTVAARTRAGAGDETPSGTSRRTTRTRGGAAAATGEASEAVASAEPPTVEGEAPEGAADAPAASRARTTRRSKTTEDAPPASSSPA